MPAGLLRRAIPVVVVAVVAALLAVLNPFGGGNQAGSDAARPPEPGPTARAAGEAERRPGTVAVAARQSKRAVQTERDAQPFEPLPGFETDPSDRRVGVRPRAAEAVRVDRDALQMTLDQAPSRQAAEQGAGLAKISVPNPSGTRDTFRIYQTSVMEPQLAIRHPEIQTYAGVGITNPTATIRLDLTQLGFHASVREDGGGRAWYVDPAYDAPGTVEHLSYARSALPAPQRQFEEELAETADAIVPAAELAEEDVVQRRTYDLALVNDASYARYWGTNARIVAAKVTLINRVNQIYNDDVAIELRLVHNSSRLNLNGNRATRRNGPCGVRPCFESWQLASCSGSTLDRNTWALNRIIGSGNYDIGHLVLGKDGGGIAGLGVVGGSRKGAGCTGLPRPRGDFFAVDYVAHEIGHQFNANHTFNGKLGACTSGNREGDTSVEPGSGSSVMAYAGICGSDNLQEHTDPYFSQRSIEEITVFVTGGSRGATVEPTANRRPSIHVVPRDPAVEADATIPIQTPFTLTADGSDADNDPLVYLWEQNNPGASGVHSGVPLLSNLRTRGPLFRVFGKSAEVTDNDALHYNAADRETAAFGASRTFPDMAQVLAGDTNAKNGTCAGAAVPFDECFSEFLPTRDYQGPMQFRVTARDLYALGGGTGHADVTLSIDKTAGPFLVTSRPTVGSTAEGLTTEEVSWDPAETDTNNLASDVRISLSVDGGLTFPHELVASTPNDGVHEIEMPNIATDHARIKVEAIGNYFFDVNDADFRIAPTRTVTLTEPDPTAVIAQYSDEMSAPVTITATSPRVDGEDLTATVSGVDGLDITDVTASADGERPGEATFEINGAITESPGLHEATLTVREPGPVETMASFEVDVTPEDATVEWTGPTEFDSEESTVTVPFSTAVAEEEVGPGIPGNLSRARVEFVDRGSEAGPADDRSLCEAAVEVDGSATCEATLHVPAGVGEVSTYNIGTVVGGAYVRDDPVDDRPVAVERVDDTSAPQTAILSGPANGSFVLQTTARFEYGSDDLSADEFTCWLDAAAVEPCGVGQHTWSGFAPGRSHLFRVRARDPEAGLVDTTPAERRFISPFDDSQLRRKGPWQRRVAASAYRGDYLRATSRGAVLIKNVRNVRKIALVVGTAPSYGKVAVYFKGRRIGKVNLRSSRVRGKQVKFVRGYGAPRSGQVRIVTLNRKPVRIEGLGAG